MVTVLSSKQEWTRKAPVEDCDSGGIPGKRDLEKEKSGQQDSGLID